MVLMMTRFFIQHVACRFSLLLIRPSKLQFSKKENNDNIVPIIKQPHENMCICSKRNVYVLRL